MAWRLYSPAYGWSTHSDYPRFRDSPVEASHYGNFDKWITTRAFVDGEDREVTYKRNMTAAEMLEWAHERFPWTRDYPDLEFIEVKEL